MQFNDMSHLMSKFLHADQMCNNCTADQRLSLHLMDSKIPVLS